MSAQISVVTGGANPSEATPSASSAAGSAPVTPESKRAELAARRKARAAAKARKREAARQRAAVRRAAGKSEPADPTPSSTDEEPAAPEPQEAPPARSDEEVQADLAMFWRVLWRVAGLVSSLFGWKLLPLTKAEAVEDAAALLPLARRWPIIDQSSAWVAIPFRLIERVVEKAQRAPPPPKPTGAAS